MWIKTIDLRQFRNYEQLQLSFNPELNVFVGQNAQGKTNLLESIYLLALGRSYRTQQESEVIQHKTLKCRVFGRVIRSAALTLEARFARENPKNLYVNGQKASPRDFIGHLNVVLFTPDDLQLVKGSPSIRRRFLDTEICQVDPVYRSLLTDYARILQQRNRLLKDIRYQKGNKEVLEVYDQNLVSVGSRIMAKRYQTIHKLGLLSRLMHRQISSGREELELAYAPSGRDEPLSGDNSRSFFSAFLAEELGHVRSEEVSRGYSLVGPQRDDLTFSINGMNARLYASQGQQRTAVLACRLAEMQFIRSEVGEYPVVLLDDVLSELDGTRREFLLSVLSKRVQTVITTTELGHFPGRVPSESSVFRIESGNVTAESGGDG